ncbi:MAG TPA: hypothetical protein VLU46_04315, partial [Thermoanaerobaculia bacterium]|nr:hypothetical protein [Thermoanaerobaculia bacterium]
MQFVNAGTVLQRVNARGRFALFPINAVLSIGRTLHDGRTTEVGLVGSEGMCGVDVILETAPQFGDVTVQSAGFVYSMPAEDLRHQFEGTGRLQKSLLRCTYALLDQVATNAVCGRYHAVAQRVARWLLMVDDRGGSIVATKAPGMLGSALGADDDEIENVLSKLVESGAVAHKRSAIAIRRETLEASACECYESV